jgi:hypothetical protein
MRSYSLNSVFAVLTVISVPMAITAGCGSNSDSEFQNGSSSGSSGSSSGNSSGFVPGDGDAGGGGERPCEGLECQQVACENGGTTSLSGTVFAPNGTLPLYNAIVYVPNAPVDPFPTTGVTCDKCGTSPSGRPVATALSDADGKFKLTNVPDRKVAPSDHRSQRRTVFRYRPHRRQHASSAQQGGGRHPQDRAHQRRSGLARVLLPQARCRSERVHDERGEWTDSPLQRRVSHCSVRAVDDAEQRSVGRP